jgi:malate dehydrogenase (oxaloacetate-decarboxylating)(NADP+)
MAGLLFRDRARKGYDLVKARRMVQRKVHHSVMMLRTGEADGMVCGADRSYVDSLRVVLPLAELREGVHRVVGMHVLLVEGKVYIFADTTVNFAPDSRELAEIALMASAAARHFNLEPKVAFVSFSNFGDNDRPESKVPREAVRILKREHPELPVEGEMHADVAVVRGHRDLSVPDAAVEGDANVLVFPDLQSANIAFKLVGGLGQREIIGPLLYGLRYPINLVCARSSVAEIVNMAALSAYEVGRS